MPIDIYDTQIIQVRGYWEVYINGEFFCSADSLLEAELEIKNCFDI